MGQLASKRLAPFLHSTKKPLEKVPILLNTKDKGTANFEHRGTSENSQPPMWLLVEPKTGGQVLCSIDEK